MGQQSGNAMSYQQREFLQLVQGLTPHHPLPTFRTYQGNVKTLIRQGVCPLQTLEPLPPVFVSVFAVIPFLRQCQPVSGS